VDKKLNAGKYTTLWNGKDMRGKQVSSGIYFCRMRAGNFVKIRKLTLMK
jgi:flagellar hook assembly protein FlgD